MLLKKQFTAGEMALDKTGLSMQMKDANIILIGATWPEKIIEKGLWHSLLLGG